MKSVRFSNQEQVQQQQSICRPKTAKVRGILKEPGSQGSGLRVKFGPPVFFDKPLHRAKRTQTPSILTNSQEFQDRLNIVRLAEAIDEGYVQMNCDESQHPKEYGAILLDEAIKIGFVTKCRV